MNVTLGILPNGKGYAQGPRSRLRFSYTLGNVAERDIAIKKALTEGICTLDLPDPQIKATFVVKTTEGKIRTTGNIMAPVPQNL